MAMPPKAQPGPLVHGRPTVLLFMTTSEFADSQFATEVVSMANAAFGTAQAAYTPVGNLRYGSIQTFASETGGKASLFVLRFEEPRPTDAFHGLIATSACKPSSGWVTSEAWEAIQNKYDRSWIRSGSIAKPINGVVDWELKSVTTSPGCARQGIARWMIERAEKEMTRRTRKAKDVGLGSNVNLDWDVVGILREHNSAEGSNQRTSSRIRIMCSTLSEDNRSFYEKRGYKLVGEFHVPVEIGGGAQPHHVAHMDKFMSI